MLIIGGGYIGLEMATFYQGIGSSVDVAEFLPEILSDMDNDLVKVLYNEIKDKFNIMTNTKVKAVKKDNKKAKVEFEAKDGKVNTKIYDRVLVCVGRKPNTKKINIENIGLDRDKYGFIQTNMQGRTLVPNIFAIGDIVGNPMLAHKANHQGKVVAEVISGKRHFFDPNLFPTLFSPIQKLHGQVLQLRS